MSRQHRLHGSILGSVLVFLEVTDRIISVSSVCQEWRRVHREAWTWSPVLNSPHCYFRKRKDRCSIWEIAIKSTLRDAASRVPNIRQVILQIPAAIEIASLQWVKSHPEPEALAYDYEDWEGYDPSGDRHDRACNYEDYWKDGGREGDGVHSREHTKWQQSQEKWQQTCNYTAIQADGLHLSLAGSLVLDPSAFKEWFSQLAADKLRTIRQAQRAEQRRLEDIKKAREKPGTIQYQVYTFISSGRPYVVLPPANAARRRRIHIALQELTPKSNTEKEEARFGSHTLATDVPYSRRPFYKLFPMVLYKLPIPIGGFPRGINCYQEDTDIGWKLSQHERELLDEWLRQQC